MFHIDVINKVPDFLRFYEQARGRAKDEVFAIWKEEYGFAALPPVSGFDELARQGLEQAMPRYEGELDSLRAFIPNEEEVAAILQEVGNLLAYTGELRLVLLYFIGFFEGNPFVAPMGDGRLAICLPVELGQSRHSIFISHELTHIVHSQLNGTAGGWERSVAELILSEGLAMRVSQHLCAGQADEAYLEHRSGWLEAIAPYEQAILTQIQADLDQTDSATLFRYTMGTGHLGFEREAYLVGWQLVADLLHRGYSYAQLARISAEDTVAFVKRVLADYAQSKQEKTP